MTEITDKNKIHWPAFTVALFMGPVLVTLILAVIGGVISSFSEFGGILVLIAVFSLMLGGPVYLAFGTPALVVLLQNGFDGYVPIAMAAFTVNALLWALQFALFTATGLASFDGMANGVMAYGLIFAPLWGAGFAIVYAQLTKHGG